MADQRLERRTLILGGVAGLVGSAGCGELVENGSQTNEERTSEKGGSTDLEILSAELRVNRPDIDDGSILVNEPIEISAAVANVGDSEETGTIYLLVGETEFDSRNLSLEAGETHETSFEIEITEPGTVDIAVNDTLVKTVTVSAPIDHGRRIGAHYYAWYWGDDGYGGGDPRAADHPDSWLSDTPGEPLLGAYNSREHEVINQHIKWSLEHGINWWIINTGTPNGPIDRTIRNVLFESELADQMAFTMLFGFDPDQRSGSGYDLDDPALREYLRDRFIHWEETKVDHDSYLHIDGRPTMYFWDSNIYFGDVAGAFEEAKAAIEADPYIIGGPNYFWQPHREKGLTEVYDAVKDYHSISGDDEYMARFRERTVVNQRRWRAATDELGVDFFPTVTPGYDPSEMDHFDRIQPIARDSEAFAEECTAVRGLADRDTIVVTSFNEWPEHTVVEPSETEGSTFLDIIEEQLARTDWESPHLDYRPLTIAFENTRSIGGRELAFQTRELIVETETESVRENVGSLDETFVYIDGVFGPEEHMETSRWFGGNTATTELLVEVESAIKNVRFVGRTPGDPITATVHTREGELGSVTLEGDSSVYEVG